MSWTSSPNLYDPVRRRWVRRTPEEEVRQALIASLYAEGVPLHQMVVEVDLQSLLPGEPPVRRQSRRIDLAWVRPSWGLPNVYLLAECKAGPLGPAAYAQLLAYQASCQARWLILASATEMLHYDARRPAAGWSPGLPTLGEEELKQ